VNTFSYGAFVSPHGGLGGPPKFCSLLIHQRRGDRAVGSGGFCLTPVIVCLFFMAGVLTMLEIQVQVEFLLESQKSLNTSPHWIQSNRLGHNFRLVSYCAAQVGAEATQSLLMG
jgi:hypothetical protein